MSVVTPAAVRRYEWVPGQTAADLALGAPQAGGAYAHALVLLEHDGMPWGVVGVTAADGAVGGDAIVQAVIEQSSGKPWEHARAAGDAGAPVGVRVVVTAGGDPWRVVRAVGALLASPDPDLEVVVVGHGPRAAGLGGVLADTFPGDVRLAWRHAGGAGRAAARNLGAEGVAEGVIAFLDDDTVAHPYWLTALREAMRDADPEGIAVGIGRVVPLTLETGAQWLQFRASASGRRPEALARLDCPAIWAASGDHAPAAAADAGLCVSASAFDALGGFDPRLGAGTPSAGGDDVDLVLRARRAGKAVRDIPRAIVFREYPDAQPTLERDAFARGAGVSAAMANQLVAGRGTGRRRVRGAAAALRVGHVARLRAYPDVVLESGSPRTLAMIERLGLIVGPVAYARTALGRRRGAR